jgi:hypothetical protein
MTPQEKNVFGKLFTKTELGTHKIDLALSDDVREAENNLKTALLSFGQMKQDFEKARANFKKEADKAYNVALKYNATANDLGLKAMDNPNYKAINAYLDSDLYRSVDK